MPAQLGQSLWQQDRFGVCVSKGILSGRHYSLAFPCCHWGNTIFWQRNVYIQINRVLFHAQSQFSFPRISLYKQSCSRRRRLYVFMITLVQSTHGQSPICPAYPLLQGVQRIKPGYKRPWPACWAVSGALLYHSKCLPGQGFGRVRAAKGTRSRWGRSHCRGRP